MYSRPPPAGPAPEESETGEGSIVTRSGPRAGAARARSSRRTPPNTTTNAATAAAASLSFDPSTIATNRERRHVTRGHARVTISPTDRDKTVKSPEEA